MLADPSIVYADIPPRLPVAAIAPIQLSPEELYDPRLNVSAEMANDFPPIVKLTLGMALQGTGMTRLGAQALVCVGTCSCKIHFLRLWH